MTAGLSTGSIVLPKGRGKFRGTAARSARQQPCFRKIWCCLSTVAAIRPCKSLAATLCCITNHGPPSLSALSCNTDLPCSFMWARWILSFVLITMGKFLPYIYLYDFLLSFFSGPSQGLFVHCVQITHVLCSTILQLTPLYFLHCVSSFSVVVWVFVLSDSCERVAAAHRLVCPWGSQARVPAGVGCHFPSSPVFNWHCSDIRLLGGSSLFTAI